MKRKKYNIVFEGPTAVGKTIYAKYLVEALQKYGIATEYVKLSPSQNVMGRVIKNLPIHLPYLLEDFFYLIDNFIELSRHSLSNAEITVYDKSPFNILAFWRTFRSSRYISILEKLAVSLYSSFQPNVMLYLGAEYEERRERVNKKNPRSKMDEFLIQQQIDEKLEKHLYQCSRIHIKSEIKYIDTTNKDIEETGNRLLDYILEMISGEI